MAVSLSSLFLAKGMKGTENYLMQTPSLMILVKMLDYSSLQAQATIFPLPHTTNGSATSHVISGHLYLLKCCLFVSQQCIHCYDCRTTAHIQPLHTAYTPVHLSPLDSPAQELHENRDQDTSCYSHLHQGKGFGIRL